MSRSPRMPGDAGNLSAAAPVADDGVASDLRGFGAVGIMAIFVILGVNFVGFVVGGVLVLLWAWRSHTPWSEIGYARPRSWARTLAFGITFGIAFKLLMKAIVMPILGAPPINQTYHYLAGNSAALPGMVVMLFLNAGFGEETVFRGYMFERLGKLFGKGRVAKASIVLLTSVLFGLAHYQDQRLAGAEQATITGIVFGTIFAITGRIWITMIVHLSFDLAAIAIIYWNLENGMAHLVFK